MRDVDSKVEERRLDLYQEFLEKSQSSNERAPMQPNTSRASPPDDQPHGGYFRL